MNFQAITEVTKPLASAAKIANKGNIIVLDADGRDSYIYNKSTKTKIFIQRKNNVYVMSVDFMADVPEVPFPWPVQVIVTQAVPVSVRLVVLCLLL